jgi:hypothetical protein
MTAVNKLDGLRDITEKSKDTCIIRCKRCKAGWSLKANDGYVDPGNILHLLNQATRHQVRGRTALSSPPRKRGRRAQLRPIDPALNCKPPASAAAERFQVSVRATSRRAPGRVRQARRSEEDRSAAAGHPAVALHPLARVCPRPLGPRAPGGKPRHVEAHVSEAGKWARTRRCERAESPFPAD